MATVNIFKFRGIEGLYADAEGNFFFNGKPARKVYNNGSISVLCGRSKRGLITLRKLAYKSVREKEEDLPF